MSVPEEYTDVDKRVAEILDTPDPVAGESSDLVTLESGVVLEVRRIPPMLLADVEKRFPLPAVPKVMDDTKGRSIENPNDPTYLKAIERNEQDKSLALAEVMVGMGTRLVSYPDDMEGPDGADWKEEAEIYLGKELPAKSPRALYLFWLKYYALTTQNDLVLLSNRVARKMGVSQEDVSSAMNSFRS